MARKTIRNRIILLTLIPTLSICLALGVGLTVLYLHQLESIHTERGAVASERLAKMAALAPVAGNGETLRALLNATLEEPGVKAVQILDSPDRVVESAGTRLSLPPDLQKSAAYSDTTVSLKNRHSHYFIAPILASGAGNPTGWVVLEIGTTHFAPMKYRGLVVALGTAILVLGTTALLALNLNNTLSLPLEKLKQGINQLAQGNLDTRIKIDEDNEFNELAERINQMARALNRSQREMRQHIDQSAEELREIFSRIEAGRMMPDDHQDNFDALQNQHIALFDMDSMSRLQLYYHLDAWRTRVLELTRFHDILPAVKQAQENAFPVKALILDTLRREDKVTAETLRSLINQLEQHFHCKVVLLTSASVQRRINEEIGATSAVVVNKPISHNRLYQALCSQLNLDATGATRPAPASAAQAGQAAKIRAVDGNQANLKLADETGTAEENPREPTAVDVNECLRLTIGNATLAKDMLSMLVKSLPKQADTIGQALESRNYSNLADQIHQLHGGCCYCGVPRLRKICATLDTRLRQGRNENLDKLVAELATEIDNVLKWVADRDIEKVFNDVGASADD